MNTPERWVDIGFEVEITGDGSPSLRLLKSPTPEQEKGESMHHSGGAAAETELIYGEVVRRCFDRIARPHFLSVGLGLGYVELVVARESLLKQNIHFSVESFELVPELKQWFICWLKGQVLPSEVQETYDLILKFILKETPQVSPVQVKNLLLEKLAGSEWLLQGALGPSFSLGARAHALLFDAFSSKTTPEIWTEEFLTQFFQSATAEDAVISTYACRGSLKRALRSAGFQVEVREGFQGKRNSTRAQKGLFLSISGSAEIF